MLFMAFAYFFYKRLETYTIMVYNWKRNGVIFAFQKVNLLNAFFIENGKILIKTPFADAVPVRRKPSRKHNFGSGVVFARKNKKCDSPRSVPTLKDGQRFLARTLLISHLRRRAFSENALRLPG